VKDSLDEKLAALPQMSRKDLQALWTKLFDKPPNPSLRREILVPILAYRLQERSLGGLKPSVEKRLREFAQPSSRNQNSLFRPKPGTRFVREWQDKLHEVSVLSDGYEYNDRTFTSLSEIAREITGTRWSGPAFFGLKKRDAPRAA
jgi:Protein of unknown function (DUF2924)